MSDRRTKRLSGFQYKKRRIVKEDEKKKLKDSLLKYVTKGPEREAASEVPEVVAGPSTSQTFTEMEEEPIVVGDMTVAVEEGEEAETSSDSEGGETESIASHSDSVNMDEGREEAAAPGESLIDPAHWPENLTNKMIECLIEGGPKQIISYDFPRNESGERFSVTYYHRLLKNGEKVSRQWLVYSKSKDSVFCFCCKIFGGSKMKLTDISGYSDWHHISYTLSRHEISLQHIENHKKWINLKNLFNKDATIDKTQQKLLASEKKRWHDVIERLIAVIQFLSKQCLAFRGTSNRLYDSDNGNFLKAIEMIAKFDNVMMEHIRRVQTSQGEGNKIVHYLGDKIQNEIINILATETRNIILEEIRHSKYFSIILDCTPDASHTEQLSIVIRFVQLCERNIEVKEHFIAFRPVLDTTGEGLFHFVLNQLETLNLDINNLRGQGYDNGANMRGKRIGLQQQILNVNPRALYVPCAAHSLNLVINDACKVTNEVLNFFAIVQEIYVFFASSTYRWNVFKNHVPKLSLQPVSETRWEGRIKSLKPLRFHLGEVYDALFGIQNDDSRDADTKHQAHCLALKINSFKFICSLIIWYEILSKVNVVSKLLQNPNCQIDVASEALRNLETYFENTRNEESFQNFLSVAEEFATANDLNTEFPQIQTIRQRRVRKQFDYEHEHESISDPREYFKINFFYVIMDTAFSSIQDRFSLLNNHNEVFGFFYDLKNINDSELIKHCKDLSLKFTDIRRNESDVDGTELYEETKSLKIYLEDGMSPLDIIKYIVSNDLTSIFPNIYIALRIFLTLPVTVATSERSFSKLKLIKNYLRASMLQERLSNLALISIEHEIVESLKLDSVIQNFANLKARKIDL